MIRVVCAVSFALVCVACGGDEEPPSCQQAVGHYYEAGCSYFDQNGNPIAAGDLLGVCQETLRTAPRSCIDAIDDWLFCLDSVPSPAESNADCDCSRELDAILRC